MKKLSLEVVVKWIIIGMLVVVAYQLLKLAGESFNKFGSDRDDKNAAKSSCSRQASEANSEFAAKGIYKSCMKRRGY